jgi:hypothetical protein
MTLFFEELDDITRQHMLNEFDAEEASGHPYRSKKLSASGLQAFPALMREAIQHGNEDTLCDALLSNLSYWQPVSRSGRTNYGQSAEALAITEFNTWYVRGLAKRLLQEGIAECQVYRAALPKGARRGECTEYEDKTVSVQAVYDGHRIRYWPTATNPRAFSIPSGVSCHHSIRRIKL